MKILIADDDPVIRKQLEMSLTKQGYGLVECTDGQEAWEHVQSEDCPSMMILDWSMPGMPGLELCVRIRGLGKEPQPYIIMLTSKKDVNDVIAGLDSGADDYITKPFYPHELHARIKVGIRSLSLQEKLLDALSKLEREATHDYLTGILNRRAVINALRVELERSLRKSTPLSVALFDLDHFKKVNDTHGHQVGDEVLCETAKRIGESLRPYDKFGRYGGEEFLLVFPDCEIKDALRLCARMRTLICDEAMSTSAGVVPVAISMGLYTFDGRDGASVEQIVQRADDALYRAKEAGRNRVETAET